MTGLAANQEDGGGGEGGGGGGAVAVSLIDALQRWADALEAQIDIMKSEVEGVRAANKELTRQARMMQGRTVGSVTRWQNLPCLVCQPILPNSHLPPSIQPMYLTTRVTLYFIALHSCRMDMANYLDCMRLALRT